MSRIQFWILNVTSFFVGATFLVQVYFVHLENSATADLQQTGLAIQEGERMNELFKQVAIQTYRLSQNDPALKDLLLRQGINVSRNESAANSPAAASAPVTAPPPTAYPMSVPVNLPTRSAPTPAPHH